MVRWIDGYHLLGYLFSLFLFVCICFMYRAFFLRKPKRRKRGIPKRAFQSPLDYGHEFDDLG